MSEEYGKEGQNYNFWNEQVKINNNTNDTYNEQSMEQRGEQVSMVPQEGKSEKEIVEEPVVYGQIAQPYQVTEVASVQTEQPYQASETVPVQTEQPYQASETVPVQTEQTYQVSETVPVQTRQPYQVVSEQPYQPYQSTVYTAGEQENTQSFSEDGTGKKEKKNGNHFRKKVIGLIASAAVFGVVAGGVFSGVQYVGNKMFPKKTETEKVTINQNKENTISTTTVSSEGTVTGPTDVSEVVEKTMPSIVSITSTISTNYGYFGTQDAEGSGSGIIINKGDKELLIVTNNHVIEDATAISVKFIDDSVVEAVVKGTSSTADLAVLSVDIEDIKKDTLDAISVIEMGNSSDAKVGQMAIAIGNALGYGQSVTVGYISAKDREVELEDSNTMKLLQTDAAINPGNSGGALLDKDGKLIGINSAKYSDTTVEGMGYAIPISVATPIINDLMNREILSEEEKGYLGVRIGEVSAEYNMPEGAYISAVSEDGAAKEAGILAGDIITKVDDIEITTATALQEKINSLRAGTKVTITLMRYTEGTYEEKTVKATLKDKETLNSLDTNSSQSQNSNGNTQQSPNQGGKNDSQDKSDNQDNSDENNGWSNGQQITPDDEDSLQKFFNEYFGE